MTQQEKAGIQKKFPVHVPLREAAALLGLSPRQLSHLIVNGREPFASLGANIGLRQNYVRVYTSRLVHYLGGVDMDKHSPECEQ